MSENKRVKNILQTKEGFKITTSQALAKIRSLRKWKTRDREYFELNGLWHERGAVK